MRKKALVALFILVAVLSACLFAACNDNGNDGGGEVTVSIADKSVTEVYEGRTLQLAAAKSPESVEVTWATSDAEVATVSESGLVTGVKAGKATISVKVGDETKDSVEITVKPVTVAIDGSETAEIYVTRTVQLTVTKAPADAAITWTSSDDEVATVSENGLVTGVKGGEATITATSGNASDSITVTVKDTVINAAVNADKFDMSGLYQDNAVLSGSQNSFVVFNGEASQYYVASATVKVTAPSGSDTWSRVGISHYNGEKYYGLMLSPGPDFNARKTVTMIVDATGNVEWGTITDRSQVWNQHDLGSIDFADVELTSVRAGNEFYAFINGELYYYENGIDGFTDVDTLPVLNLGSCTAEFGAMAVTYGQESVEEYLATADDSDYYASSDKVIIGDDGTIKFTGASDGSAPANPKDHAAKSIGAKVLLPADKQSTLTFDLTIDGVGDDPMPGLAVTLHQYDGAFNEARTAMICQHQAGFTGWNFGNGDLPNGIGGNAANYTKDGAITKLDEGETYKVIVTRLQTEQGQDTMLTIKDKDGDVLYESTWGYNISNTGRMYVSFLCRDLDCTISNIVIA